MVGGQCSLGYTRPRPDSSHMALQLPWGLRGGMQVGWIANLMMSDQLRVQANLNSVMW